MTEQEPDYIDVSRFNKIPDINDIELLAKYTNGQADQIQALTEANERLTKQVNQLLADKKRVVQKKGYSPTGEKLTFHSDTPLITSCPSPERAAAPPPESKREK